MINSLEHIETELKNGYRSAVLGFAKSRINGTTSYFIEIAKGNLNQTSDKIFMTKSVYIQSQNLLDKYNKLHKIEREKEKEKKLREKEERKLKEKEPEIQKCLYIPGQIKNGIQDNCEMEEKFVEPSFNEEDPVSELILGPEPMEIIDDEDDEDDEVGEDEGGDIDLSNGKKIL